MNRRHFLKSALLGAGAGASALAFPFLGSVHGRALHRSGQRPLRLVIFFHEAGILPGEFVPTSTGSDYALSPMLTPLADFRSKFDVVSGVKNEARWLTMGNNHTEAKTSLLTGVGSFSGPGEENWANGPSIDQVLADRLPATQHRTLDVLVGDKSVWYENVVSFSGPDQPVVSRYNDPLELYDALFGALSGDGAKRESRRDRRLSILDHLHKNFSYFRAHLGASDRLRLDAHQAHLYDLEKALQADVGDNCQLPPGEAQPIDFVHDIETAYRQHVDLVVRGLACDLSRIAVIYPHTQQASQFGGVDVPGGDWHLFLHTEDGDVVTELPELRRQIFQWHYHQFAYLLEQMDAIDDGDGTLLDNSLVLAISEFGNGATHDWDGEESLPIVLAGGASHGLQRGRHLAYPGRTTNDLLTTILHNFGQPDGHFGEVELNNGPLSELLAVG